MPKRKPHRVHRWRIASRELQEPHRVLYACAYSFCDATRVYDMRKVRANARKIARAAVRIFGDELSGQETMPL